ncbi:alpha/beta hydrolase [Acaryochloris sp. IP29b_bin.148]|uniref:alpha/beta hydrolase n=1 Tax=Acaryochloris sp. IP29b_bin.148 TaxID=2969218 RepID=UPI002615D787|nr:alpha/beta hydrolase [Acaryochloris sp. IP29b_bin.148]
METESGYFIGVRQHSLYYQAWLPEQFPKAVVVISHGLGCHSGTFMNAINALVPQGYAVYALDLRGHGRSAGQRGYISHWSEFRKDVQIFLQLVKRQQYDRPLFAWGHSLGGMIVLDYVLHYPHHLKGVIVSGLPMGAVGVSSWKLAIARFLSLVWPRFSLNTGIDPAVNSRDPAAIVDHYQDTLRHTKGTARLATEFLRTQNELQAHAAELTLPLLMLHGSHDQTASPTGSATFFQQVGSSSKQHLEYAGAYHDLHNDLNAHAVLADISQWLSQQLLLKKPCQLVRG